MGLFSSFRDRWARRFVRRYGCETAIAELAAVAASPFENRHPVAARAFEKEVRSISRSFVGALHEVKTAAELSERARVSVKQYYALAESYDDAHYKKSWGDALESVAKPGDSFGYIFRLDSIQERRERALAVRPDDANGNHGQLALPPAVRDRAVERMLELNADPPEHPLTRSKAEEWVEYEVLSSNWHQGWISEQPRKPTKVWPDPESWIGSRDLDASLAIWEALKDAGLDPTSYFKQAPSERPTPA